MSSLIITIIQTDLSWEDKLANLAMLEEKINRIPGKTELVILPEMFTTGFSMNPGQLAEKMDGSTVTWMKRIAMQRKIILTGSVIIEDGGKFYNRMLWILPNGELGYYDKRHLFAFAGEDQHYSAGEKRVIAGVKGWKINLQVCYDLRFPAWARQSAITAPVKEPLTPEYDLLIYAANWPEKRSTAWKTLLRARAIENQCYVVGVNRVGEDANKIYYSGDSMIIDPLGDILYEKSNQEDIYTHTLDHAKLDEVRSIFPFWKDADHINITL